MLVDSMIPEARKSAGDVAGLIAVLGYARRSRTLEPLLISSPAEPAIHVIIGLTQLR